MNKKENWSDQNQYVPSCVYPQTEISPGFVQQNNWVHVPPQTMPWGLPSNLHPAVVRFTAGHFTSQNHLPKRSCEKRKINIEFDVRSPKELVTDERMAAHMSGLHITDAKFPCLKVEDEAMDTDRLPKLVICDEVKNIKNEPLIPESFLNKIERPKMAVVLWQPPSNDLVTKLTKLKSEDEKKEEEENSMIIENNNFDNTFRPIDPVPMRASTENHFLQPNPQFQEYFPLS